MANGYSLFVGLGVIVIFCAVAWVFSPKGENQTIWRSSLCLSAVACYLMWAITFLAQLHPLIQPQANNLRKVYQ